jgi:hypothetical protein
MPLSSTAGERQRLARREVRRHGIGRGCVRRDAEPERRLPGQRQPPIAEYDVGVRQAAREEAEAGRIPGDARHHGIDFEEAPRLIGARVTGHRSRPEADDPDAELRAALPCRVARCLDAARKRTVSVVVGRGPRLGNRRAVLRLDALRAMHRRAVHEQSDLPAFRGLDPVRPEEAALGFATVHRVGQHHQRERERGEGHQLPRRVLLFQRGHRAEEHERQRLVERTSRQPAPSRFPDTRRQAPPRALKLRNSAGLSSKHRVARHAEEGSGN